MDFLHEFANDTEQDLEAQRSWQEDRPWRWFPSYLSYPMATAGALYREIRGESDASMVKGSYAIKEGKETSFKPSLMGKGKNKKKKMMAKATKKRSRVKKGKNNGKGSYGGPTKASKLYASAMNNHFASIGVKKIPKGRPPKTTYQHRMSAGPKVYFRSGRIPGALTVACTLRLGRIWKQATGSTSPSINWDAYSTTNYDYILPFNPAMPYYWPDPLYVLNKPFLMFLFKKCRIRYETSSPTLQSGKLMLGYTADVDYLESLGFTGTQQPVGEGNIARMSNAATFPLWENSTYDIDVVTNRVAAKFFIRNEWTNKNAPYTLDGAGDTAEDRQSMQGMMYVGGALPTTDAAGTYYGDLYADVVIDFWDIAQEAGTQVTPMPLTRDERRLRNRLRHLSQYEEYLVAKTYADEKKKVIREARFKQAQSQMSSEQKNPLRVDSYLDQPIVREEKFDIAKEAEYIESELEKHQAKELTGKDEMPSNVTIGYTYEDELPIEAIRALHLARHVARSRSKERPPSRSTSRER